MLMRRSLAQAPSSKPEKLKTGINAIGYVNLETGLGRACRANVSALRRSYDIGEIDFPMGSRWPMGVDYSHNYLHFNPYKRVWDRILKEPSYTLDCPSIGYWIGESPAVEESYIEMSEHLSMIWTASTFYADILASKCKAPVHVVPHIIEVPPPIPFEPMDNKFHVLIIFDGRSRFQRKNPDGAIKAFQKAFEGRDDVHLTIKCSTLSEGQRAILSWYAERDKRIEIIDNWIPFSEMENLFARASCLLSLHRAEGFGLHIGEAMLRSLPVIATGYSGNMDMCDSDTSLLVDFAMVDIKDSFYKGGEWAEPDLNDAADKLRWLKEDEFSNQVMEMKLKARTRIRNNNSEEVVSAQMAELIGEL